MTVTIDSTHDLGDGFRIEQLRNERGDIFYRVCVGGMRRYCEDMWMAQMYADQMRGGHAP